jgi:hypothetical protein
VCQTSSMIVDTVVVEQVCVSVSPREDYSEIRLLMTLSIRSIKALLGLC